MYNGSALARLPRKVESPDCLRPRREPKERLSWWWGSGGFCLVHRGGGIGGKAEKVSLQCVWLVWRLREGLGEY